MKKSIIAAGAASVALAAMPIVGVFAADPTVLGPVTDNIEATVSTGCTIADVTDSKTVELAVAPGTAAESTAAGSISIVCTGSDVAWTVSAAGAGAVVGKETKLIQRVSSGTAAEIATGTTGDAYWAFMVDSITASAGAASTTIDPDYDDWAAIPGTAGDAIATGGVGKITVNTKYKVNVPLDQAAGIYDGAVAYTVAF